MTSVAVSDVAAINPRPVNLPDAAESVVFVGMVNLDATTAIAVDVERRPYLEVKTGYTPFERGDILLAKITPCFENMKIGQAKTSTQFATGSTEFHVIRAKPGRLHDRYLLHFLRQDWVLELGELRMTGSGGQRRVPQRFLDELQIPLPPLSEQRRIAAVLDQADLLRTKRRQALAKLDTLNQAIFHDMFGPPVSNAGKALDELADTTAGNTWKSSRFSSEPVGLPLVRIQNVGAPDSECVYWPDDYKDKYVVRNGDILLSLSGSFRVAGWHGEDALLNQRILRIDPRPGVDQVWLLAALTQQIQEISSMGRDAVISNVSLKDVRALKLPEVSLEAQTMFSSRIARAATTHQTVARSDGELGKLFASLQQRAFRGEL